MTKETKRHYQLTERERDTILAALRLFSYQDKQLPLELLDIADNGRTGDNARLTLDEIDTLCEKINP